MRVLLWTLLTAIFVSSSLAAPIHEGAKSGDMAALNAAIAAGDDVNAQENRLTPLYLAVQGGHIEAVRQPVFTGFARVLQRILIDTAVLQTHDHPAQSEDADDGECQKHPVLSQTHRTPPVCVDIYRGYSSCGRAENARDL